MTSELVGITHDANDPERAARFWAGALGRELSGTTLLPNEEPGFRIRFVPTTPRIMLSR